MGPGRRVRLPSPRRESVEIHSRPGRPAASPAEASLNLWAAKYRLGHATGAENQQGTTGYIQHEADIPGVVKGGCLGDHALTAPSGIAQGAIVLRQLEGRCEPQCKIARYVRRETGPANMVLSTGVFHHGAKPRLIRKGWSGQRTTR